MYRQYCLLSLMLIMAGCSAPPQSPQVIPVPVDGVRPTESEPGSAAFEPSIVTNAASPSDAARQLINQAKGSVTSGEGEAALRFLERAQRISPRAAEIYLEMARVRLLLGQYAQAQQLARKALSLAGDDASLQQAVEALLNAAAP